MRISYFVLNSLLAVAFFCLLGCTMNEKQTDAAGSQGAVATLTEPKKLADASKAFLATEKANMTQTHPTIEFAKSGRGVVYMENVDGKGRVVHNGRPGKTYQLVGDLAISRDGNRVAYVAHQNSTFRRIVSDDVEGPLFLDIGMPKFSPDGKHLIYTVTQGKEDRLVIDHRLQQEVLGGTHVLLSPDSRYLAYAVKGAEGKKQQFIISDFSLKDKQVFDSCGEVYAVSDDQSRIAVLCNEGEARKFKIIDFQNRKEIATEPAPAAGTVIRKRFAANNQAFMFTTVTDDQKRFIHYNGRTEQIPAGDEIMTDPVLLTNPERIGVMIGNATNVRFHTVFHKGGPQEKEYGYIPDFIASADGNHHAYVAISTGGEERMRIVVDGNEGPLFDKIVSPLFSPDGRLIVYRARQDGRRFLVVADLKGKVVRRLKDYDMVFQPVFVDNGTAVAYGVLDGAEFWWKVDKL